MKAVNDHSLSESTVNVSESERFGRRLKAWRIKHRLTQPQAGQRLGVDRSWISQVENGRPPGEALVMKFDLLEENERCAHQVSDSERSGRYEVEQVISAAPAGRLVRVASWAQAGEVMDYEEIAPDWQQEIATNCPDADAIGVQIRGDSQLPIYQEGDVAIMMPSREPRTGCLVVARLRDEGVCFKLYAESSRGIIRLSSYNPAYSPFERRRDDFQWICPVYETLRNVWR